MKAKINEIFPSIQGEGPLVGYKQLFIRFCGCNLRCNYCDTKFNAGTNYTPQQLFEKITAEYDLSTFHSISLTGGEPLLQIEFLSEFLPLFNKKIKIYLETNATITKNFEKIKPYIDIISADIKLKSSAVSDTLEKHEEFFDLCDGIYTFAKIVFGNNITNDEIEASSALGEKYNIELILQPMMIDNKMDVTSDFCNLILDKYTKIYPNVRLIPQVHKFLNVR